MSLTAGSRLGVYEVLGSLGAGGMGEVYRARDTKLNRDVAIKILPEAVAADPERLARFEREAQTLAALNHPHIAQIYGLEETSPAGVTALVMELVEGRTLEELMAGSGSGSRASASSGLDSGSAAPRAAPGRGLGIETTVSLAIQIADALEAAHGRGIVHRDLKPANIRVRTDGVVKVLDFGLAKTADADAAADPTNSPTFTSPALTEQGLVLGTAAYMAPEQARGRPVDKRADIWAFGVVLFEMLAGRRLFAGETVSDTLAAVLREEIPWSDLPPDTPHLLRRVLERCLTKDPARRLRDIGDARLDLEDVAAGRGIPVETVAAPAAGADRRWVPWGVAAAAVALAVWALIPREPIAEARWQQFTQVTDMAGEETAPTLSPDGSTVAYAALVDGSWDIYAQRVGGRNRIVIAGNPDRHEARPAFSPGGDSVAYHESDADGGIFIVGATGESSRRLTDFGFDPAWSPDGQRIAFTTEEIVTPYTRLSTSALWVVDISGGAPRKLIEGDAVQAAWSPSGGRIAFWAVDGGQRDLFTIPAGGGPRTAVLSDAALDWCPVWSPDGRYLYFASDRGGSLNLWRIAIDEASGEARGAPEPVTTGVQAAAELPAFSADGSRLAFRSRVGAINPVAVPYDPAANRAGTPEALSNANNVLVPTDVSPDGRWLLLYNIGARQEDLFISASDLSGLRRLTDDPPRDRTPRFTRDGRAAVFYSNRDGRYEVWTIRLDGGGLRKLVTYHGDALYPLLSPSGDRLVFTTMAWEVVLAKLPDANGVVTDLATLPGTTTDEWTFMATDWSRVSDELAGYLSTREGNPIAVAVYDIASGSMRRLTDDRPLYLRWTPDGRRLLYFSRNNTQLVSVDAQTGQRTVLRDHLPLPATDDFAIAPDGRTIYYGGLRSEADIWIVERVGPT